MERLGIYPQEVGGCKDGILIGWCWKRIGTQAKLRNPNKKGKKTWSAQICLRLLGCKKPHIDCFVRRRIWAHEISLFVPRPRDNDHHPGSGLAQDLLRLAQPKNHFGKAAPQHATMTSILAERAYIIIIEAKRAFQAASLRALEF